MPVIYTVSNLIPPRLPFLQSSLSCYQPSCSSRELFCSPILLVALGRRSTCRLLQDSFTATDGARFQIAAIDPDFGNPDLHDQVRFFIGTPEEHGGILGNPVYVPLPDNTTVQVFTWYEDYYYAFICQQGLAISSALTNNPADEICTSQM